MNVTDHPAQRSPLVEVRHLHVRFGRPGGAARHQPEHSPRPDRGGDRRERLRQDGAAEGPDPPGHGRRSGEVLFDGRNLARAVRPGADAAADPVRVRVSERGPVRQPDDRPERGLSAAAARAATATPEIQELVLARLAEVGLPDRVVAQEAGGVVRRHAQAGRAWRGP